MSQPGRLHPLLRFAAIVQGAVYVLTGLWPLVNIRSFQLVTGPKFDLWLVKTVGLLVLVSGCVFLIAAWRKRVSLEILILAVGDALALTIIDVTYVSIGRIPPVYLLDAAAETILAVCWLVGIWLQRRSAVR